MSPLLRPEWVILVAMGVGALLWAELRWSRRRVRSGIRSSRSSRLARVAIPILLATTALGPSLGERPVERPARELDLWIALDVSRSMTVGAPSRFDRGVRAVELLLWETPGVAVGLAVFGGQGVPILPPTRDPSVVRTFLAALSPGVLSDPGSSSESVRTLLEQVRSRDTPGPVHLVLVTDGEWSGADDAISAGSVRVHALHVSRPESGSVRGADGRLVGPSTVDRAGLDRRVRRMENAGRVVDASAVDEVSELGREISAEAVAARHPWTEERPVDGTPIAALALLVALFAGRPPRRRP